MAGGVDTAYQTAHAGAGDVIHRDVVFLQPGDDADVRQSERATALQHQAYRSALWFGWLLLRDRR